MVATLVLQRDENGDLHDPGGLMCNAAGRRIDGQGTAILEPSAATKDKVSLQRSLADLTRPSQFYTNRKDGIYDREGPENSAEDECILKSEVGCSLQRANGKLETLDAHVMMLDAQVSQTAEAVKKQKALVKGKAVESERHQVARTGVDRHQQLSTDRHQQLSTDRHHQPRIERHHCWYQTKLFEFRATQILPLDTRILPP
ncbi:hypothetical protein F2Q68_00044106 [Brassica cretica]|nr:hypothetical protein F2Q68_00044106 [Brassica cretica]